MLMLCRHNFLTETSYFSIRFRPANPGDRRPVVNWVKDCSFLSALTPINVTEFSQDIVAGT